VPIFNVRFELQCVFMAAVHDAKPSFVATGPAGATLTVIGEGDEIIRRPWGISTAKIDPGCPFVFYLDNPNAVWVDVTAPETIEFQRLGSDLRETARLIRPYRKSVNFSPPAAVGIPHPTEKTEEWLLPKEAAERFAPSDLVTAWKSDGNYPPIVDYLHAELLAGRLIARGTPHRVEVGTDYVVIQRGQWQSLKLHGPEFSSAGSSIGPMHSYNNLEIKRA